MVLMRVEYDTYSSQFKILDRELARTLKDGETYMLIADISVKHLEMQRSADAQVELVPVTA